MVRIFAAFAGAIAVCVVLGLAGGPALAADVPAHKIVSVDGEPSARTLAVRLDQRLTEKALKELAAAIATKVKSGERVATIKFYLPFNELAESPWAVARTQGSDTTVLVSGLRAEEEAAFRAEAESDSRDVVGVWLTSPPALPGKLTIVRAQKGRFIAEWHLRSGQKTTDEVTMARVSRGYRYDVVGGDGAYYLATWAGPLQLGDATRTIALAEKLAVEKKPQVAASKKDVAPATGKAVPPAAQGTTTTAAAAPAAVEAVSAPQRVRRSKQAATRKTRASVADLMGGSIAR